MMCRVIIIIIIIIIVNSSNFWNKININFLFLQYIYI